MYISVSRPHVHFRSFQVSVARVIPCSRETTGGCTCTLSLSRSDLWSRRWSYTSFLRHCMKKGSRLALCAQCVLALQSKGSTNHCTVIVWWRFHPATIAVCNAVLPTCGREVCVCVLVCVRAYVERERAVSFWRCAGIKVKSLVFRQCTKNNLNFSMIFPCMSVFIFNMFSNFSRVSVLFLTHTHC